MLNAPGHDDSDPSECPYCGTRFNAPLALCPQCGANQVAAAARIAAASEGLPGERAHGINPFVFEEIFQIIAEIEIVIQNRDVRDCLLNRFGH